MTPADIAPALPPRKGYLAAISVVRHNIPFSVGLGMTWLATMVLIAIFAHLIMPYGITAMDLTNRLAGPGNPQHWLGTDELGRDVLSRLLQSVRVSLVIAFGATIISAVVGTTLGFMAAKFRGTV